MAGRVFTHGKRTILVALVLCCAQGCSTVPACPVVGWNGSMLNIGQRTYQGPALPSYSDVASVQPIFPPGRNRVINTLATWGHKGSLKNALAEPNGCPSAFPANRRRGDRSGVLVLRNGTRMNYLVRSGWPEQLHLEFPSGRSVVLDVDTPEDEEDED